MSAAHTAGPWQVDPENPVIVRDAEGNMIADCDVFQYTDDGEVQLEDCPANALICAAAPDMLKALSNAMVALAMLEARTEHGAKCQQSAILEARAAIRSARGEESAQ